MDLSTGFLEPLEATSMWVSALTLKGLLRLHLPLNETRARQDLNAFYRQRARLTSRPCHSPET